MTKKLTQGVSFLASNEMHDQLRKISEQRDIKISQLLRTLVRDFLRSESSKETKSNGDILR